MMIVPLDYVDARDAHLCAGALTLDREPAVGATCRLRVHNLDSDGAYIRTALLAYPKDTTLYVECTKTPHWASFALVATPTARVGFVELRGVCVDCSRELRAGPVEMSILGGGVS